MLDVKLDPRSVANKARVGHTASAATGGDRRLRLDGVVLRFGLDQFGSSASEYWVAAGSYGAFYTALFHQDLTGIVGLLPVLLTTRQAWDR